MKTIKNEQKPSLNYPSTVISFKRMSHYFHPDDDFREDHHWGNLSKSTEASTVSKRVDFSAKKNTSFS